MVTYDFSMAPILVAEILPVEPSHENVDHYIKTIKENTLEREEDTVIWILDLSKGKYLKTEFRIKFNDVYNTKTEGQRRMLGKIKYMLYVNSNILISAVLKTIFTFQRQVLPTKVFKTREEAFAFAKKELNLLP